MPHSEGLSYNPYPELNQPGSHVLILISTRSILILTSHLHLGLPKGFFPVGSPVKIKVNTDRELKEVDHFKYLGSVLTRNDYCLFRFQDKNLNLNRDSNLGSPDH